MLELSQPTSEQPWASIARTGFGLLAVFLYTAPFVVQRLRDASWERAVPGVDLDQLVLLMGVGGASAVAMASALVAIRFGGSVISPYAWSALAFFVSAFWCWRLWHVLR
jgi:hypothetical protein